MRDRPFDAAESEEVRGRLIEVAAELAREMHGVNPDACRNIPHALRRIRLVAEEIPRAEEPRGARTAGARCDPTLAIERGEQFESVRLDRETIPQTSRLAGKAAGEREPARTDRPRFRGQAPNLRSEVERRGIDREREESTPFGAEAIAVHCPWRVVDEKRRGRDFGRAVGCRDIEPFEHQDEMSPFVFVAKDLTLGHGRFEERQREPTDFAMVLAMTEVLPASEAIRGGH